MSATVAEEIEALRNVGGDKAVALIRREPDATVARIVETWPEAFEPEAPWPSASRRMPPSTRSSRSTSPSSTAAEAPLAVIASAAK